MKKIIFLLLAFLITSLSFGQLLSPAGSQTGAFLKKDGGAGGFLRYKIQNTRATGYAGLTFVANNATAFMQLKEDGVFTMSGFTTNTVNLNDTLHIGFPSVTDAAVPVFRMLGDADADGTATTSEVLKLRLTANATPTLATWDFTSTQSAGYKFDKKIYGLAGVDLGTSQALTGTTAMTIGDNSQTVAINSSDWDISTTGAMTGIGAITADGIITGTAGATISGAATSINASSNFTTNIGTGTTTGTVTIGGGSNAVAINSSSWGITSGGVFSGMLRVIVPNTTGTQSLTAAQTNCVVTCSYGSGATTVTIPDPSAATVGVIYYIIQTANQNLVVTSTTANNNAFVCNGVATSDNITISTSGKKIGAGMIVIGISATQWYVGGLNPESLLTPEAAD